MCNVLPAQSPFGPIMCTKIPRRGIGNGIAEGYKGVICPGFYFQENVLRGYVVCSKMETTTVTVLERNILILRHSNSKVVSKVIFNSTIDSRPLYVREN